MDGITMVMIKVINSKPKNNRLTAKIKMNSSKIPNNFN